MNKKGIYRITCPNGTIEFCLLAKAKHNDVIEFTVNRKKSQGIAVQPWEAKEIIQGFKMCLKEYYKNKPKDMSKKEFDYYENVPKTENT